MKAQVTLTPPESKRLIAKAVANMDIVRKALRTGRILLGRGTTNAFILEELLGERVVKGKFVSGIITPSGPCMTSAEVKLPMALIEKGNACKDITEDIGVKALLERFNTTTDVLIKGANAIDPEGNVAIFLGDPGGGRVIPIIKKIEEKNLIIPVGLEKLVPISVTVAAKETWGAARAKSSMGTPVFSLPVRRGTVVTEIEAVSILTDAQAVPIGAGGIGGAEGSMTLIVKGNSENVLKALRIIEKCKGEGQIQAFRENCSRCILKFCPHRAAKQTDMQAE